VEQKKDAAIFIENVLSSVPVVHVPIDDQHFAHTVSLLRMAGCHGDVIHDAESHAVCGTRMVSRWPYDTECAPRLAGANRVHRGECAAAGTQHSRPRVLSQIGIAGRKLGHSAVNLLFSQPQVRPRMNQLKVLSRCVFRFEPIDFLQ
jgi:hypothetical protein